MPTLTAPATDSDIRIPTPVLCALWRAVEVWVFVVLLVKDRSVPSWHGPARAAR